MQMSSLRGSVGLGRLAALAPPSSLPICVPPCGTTDPLATASIPTHAALLGYPR